MAALAALATLHRRHKRLADLLEVLRRELKLAAEQRSAARAAPRDGARGRHGRRRRPQGARSAPIARRCSSIRRNAAALSGLERLCRREGNWEVLAEALRRAPRSVRTVRALCEALEHLERWEELGEAREAELALLEEPKEIARAARALADLYERRLDDPDAAARAWHRVDEADPRDPQAARALERIYESRGRFADLAAAIERELQLEASLEPARRLELWLRARRDPQGAAVAARVGGRGVRERAQGRSQPRRRAGVAGRDLLGAQAGRRSQPRARHARARRRPIRSSAPACLSQKGDLLERNGDLDGALTPYTESFRLDPASRACFTAFERVCYKREKWRQAMELYETAIRARRGAAVARLSPRRSVRAARAAAAAVSRAAGRGGGVVPARARARSRGRHGADGARAHLLGAVRLAGADLARTSGAPSWCATTSSASRSCGARRAWPRRS